MTNKRLAEAAYRAMPIYVRALGRSADVEVEIHGSKAFTDKDRASGRRRVVLPDIDPTDEDAVSMTYAYAQHEIAHLRYGDLEAWEREWDNMSPLKRILTNIVCDVVDERSLIQNYPGALRDFNRGYRRLVQDSVFQPVTAEDKPVNQMTGYLLYRMRNEVLGQRMFDELAEGAERHARTSFSPGCMAKLGSIIARVNAIEATTDAMRLADEILKVLKDESDDKPPEQPTADEQSAAGSDSTPGSSGADAGEENESKSSQAARDSLNASEEDLKLRDVGQMMAKELEGAADEAVKESGHGGFGAGGGYASPPSFARRDDSLLAKVRSTSNAIRNRLLTMVEASREEDEWVADSGIVLDDFLIDRIPIGETSVFRNDTEVDGVNTAIVIMLDRSGSMGGSKIEIAREAALAVSHAVEQIPDVKVSVGAFPGEDNEVLPILEFGEQTKATAGRFSDLHASGGTPMTEAIWWGLEALLYRQETRKLLFVVTDGSPNNSVSTSKAIEVSELCGVETYGIGVGKTPVSTLFPRSCEIDSVQELARNLFGILQASLQTQAT